MYSPVHDHVPKEPKAVRLLASSLLDEPTLTVALCKLSEECVLREGVIHIRLEG